MSAFKLKNKYLVGLGSWLNELPLQGRESRERTRFVNKLVERLSEIEKFRAEILNKYVLKDKEGKPLKKLNEAGEELWDVPDESLALYSKEYVELMDEEFVIDSLEGTKPVLKIIKSLVLDTSYVFGPKENDTSAEKDAKIRQMNDYDSWCQAFEAVEYSD